MRRNTVYKRVTKNDLYCIYANLSGEEYPMLYSDSKLLLDETKALQQWLGGIRRSQKAKKDVVTEVVRFLRYLRKNNVQLELITDNRIRLYRNSLLVSDDNPNQVKRKRSINLYLKYIYNFLSEYYLLDPCKRAYLIGSHNLCAVKSGLINSKGDPMREEAKVYSKRNYRVKNYPLQFDDLPNLSGVSALTKEQIPTEDHFNELLEAIESSSSNSFTRERDKLIVKLAKSSAMRRGSINSLRANQFVTDKIEQSVNDGVFLVTPPKQKFGYQRPYEIDLMTAFEVNSYINKYLKPYLYERNLLTRWSGAVFVKVNGEVLDDNYISKRIREKTKALGWPKGRLLHVFRHLFAMEYISKEYNRQMTKKGATPQSAIDAAVINLRDKLGHLSTESQKVYLSLARAFIDNDVLGESMSERKKLEMYRAVREKQELYELRRRSLWRQ